MCLQDKINEMQGPILVLGSSGFVGANLFRLLHSTRSDVYGTINTLPAWRLSDLETPKIIRVDLLDPNALTNLINKIKPRTVINCVSYGAYSFETDSEKIYQTNFVLETRLLKLLEQQNIYCYLHAGTSSEYGENAAGPEESAFLSPNSDYSVSKIASTNLIYYYGKKKGMRCANLRLYSAYGPYEDSARLIPAVVTNGAEGKYPKFVNPTISRDFVYVGDVCEAFVYAAVNLKPESFGESFNIGTGKKTTISEIADLAQKVLNIKTRPEFDMPQRAWDVEEWYANPQKAEREIGWKAKTELTTGLNITAEWYRNLKDKESYFRLSKRVVREPGRGISAIIACYRDEQAIPIMYQRLTAVFSKIGVDYEIIFVNDNSPDNSEQVIQKLTETDKHVIGISHSRNFGSQAAFKSGMGIASKDACVLLDGDLQDPPEMIEAFYHKWCEGYDVVYGRRVKREAPLLMQLAYKGFYRVFDYFSYLNIPHDAGDFALMDKRVVSHILECPERDLFLRGLRAFVGFRQTGIDYLRPERMFGKSTNNLAKNIGWAKKGILSFSNTPLNILSFVGVVLFIVSVLLGCFQIISRLILPGLAPQGLTTVLLSILFFGSINLLAVGLVGEYIAKIFEEIKHRPPYIRRSIIKDGEVRNVQRH